MKKNLKNLFNAASYKRKFNTYKAKYDEVLESKVADKEQIIELQKQVIRLQEENDYYQKEIINKLQENITEIKLKYKKLKEKNGNDKV